MTNILKPGPSKKGTGFTYFNQFLLLHIIGKMCSNSIISTTGYKSELVQLKLNIGASDGDSTPPETKRGTPTYRSGSIKKQIRPDL